MKIFLGFLSFILTAWIMLILPTVDYPEIAYCIIAGLIAAALTVCIMIYMQINQSNKKIEQIKKKIDEINKES